MDTSNSDEIWTYYAVQRVALVFVDVDFRRSVSRNETRDEFHFSEVLWLVP